jgi:hypothetical protein
VAIVPAMEEVFVVEQKLLLNEELRITQRTKTIREPRRMIVQSEKALVENRKKKMKPIE